TFIGVHHGRCPPKILPCDCVRGMSHAPLYLLRVNRVRPASAVRQHDVTTVDAGFHHSPLLARSASRCIASRSSRSTSYPMCEPRLRTVYSRSPYLILSASSRLPSNLASCNQSQISMYTCSQPVYTVQPSGYLCLKHASRWHSAAMVLIPL